MAYRNPVFGAGTSSTPGTIKKYASATITFDPAPSDGDPWKFSENHGLGGVPDVVQVFAECTVADGGYAIGDRVPVNCSIDGGLAYRSNEDKLFVVATATQVELYFTCDGEDGIANLRNKTNGRLQFLNLANWKFRVVALRFS